jgi:hypothetical protein
MTPDNSRMLAVFALGALAGLSATGCQSRRDEGTEAPVVSRLAVAPIQANVDQSYRGGRNVTEYPSIAGPTPFMRPTTLCEIIQGLRGPAGVYRVDHLFGVTERVGDSPDVAATYVELSLLSSWTDDAPEHPIARVGGGPASDDGIVQSWSLSLAKGEEVGLLLTEPLTSNNRYFGIHNLALFRPTSSGGVSNGQLFTRETKKTADLGAIVKATRSRTDGICPEIVVPDIAGPAAIPEAAAGPGTPVVLTTHPGNRAKPSGP